MEKFQSTHIAQNEKVCSGKNTEGVSQQPFAKEITGASHGLNQPSQKPKIEMGLYQLIYCWLGLRTETMRQNEGRLLDVIDPTGPDHRANVHCSSREVKNDFGGNSE